MKDFSPLDLPVEIRIGPPPRIQDNLYHLNQLNRWQFRVRGTEFWTVTLVLQHEDWCEMGLSQNIQNSRKILFIVFLFSSGMLPGDFPLLTTYLREWFRK